MSIRILRNFYRADAPTIRNSVASGRKYSKRLSEKESHAPTESDPLLIRLLGSDWADRRGQPVSTLMKLYWGIFTVVIGSGLYTHWKGLPGSMLPVYCVVYKPY